MNLSQEGLRPDLGGNTFDQAWSPCTRTGTIYDYINSMRFPTTFRLLCQQWNSLDRPGLSTLQCPRGLLYLGNNEAESPQDLELLTSLQEIMTMGIFAGYFREGIIPPSMPFVDIASHIHIYSSVKVELDHSTHRYSESQQLEAYDYQWRSMIAALDQDRHFCLHQPVHDCMGRLLWGDTYWLSAESIATRFQQFQQDSSQNIFRPLPLTPLSIFAKPSSKHISSVNTLHNPHTSSLGLMNTYPEIGRINTSTASEFGHGVALESPLGSTFSGASMSSIEQERPTGMVSNYHSLSVPLLDRTISSSSSGTNSSQSTGLTTSSHSLPSQSPRWASLSPHAKTTPLHKYDAQLAQSRAEQNRRKSKKHYERKKLQRNLLGDLVSGMEKSLEFLAEQNRHYGPLIQAIRLAVTSPVHVKSSFSSTNYNKNINSGSSSSSRLTLSVNLTPNEKKKLNKVLQNDLEMERITRISRIAEAFLQNLDMNLSSTRTLLCLQFQKAKMVHRTMISEPQDVFLLPWVHCKPSWDDLISAEHRISKEDEAKPIAKLIKILQNVSSSSFAAAGGSSSK